MTNTRIWHSMLAAAVAATAIVGYTGTRTVAVSVQDGNASPVAGKATAGRIDTKFVASARQVVLSQLPLAKSSSSTSGAVWHRIVERGAAEGAAQKAQAAPVRFAPTAPVLPTAQFGARPSDSEGDALTPTSILSFDGDGQGLTCSGPAPADMALAIGDGANPIVQAVNSCLSVWAPNGNHLAGPVSLQSFFGLNANTNMGPPRAQFDWYNHRFIVLAADTDFALSNNYDIAVSQSNDPTGGWYTYRIPVPTGANALPDFARLGQDRTVAYPGYPSSPGGIYIASDLLDTSNNFQFLYEEWLLLPKGPMYAGAQFQFAHTAGASILGAFTDGTQPAAVWSPYEQPRAMFMITSKNRMWGGGNCVSGCNGLTIWAISNPFSFVNGGPLPDVSGAAIPTNTTYFRSPPAQQPGQPNSINTLDTRITGQATYAHGFIHAALHAANGSGGTESIFYRIRPLLSRNNDVSCNGAYLNLCPEIQNASVFSEHILNYGTTTAAFFPTPQPDLEGNMTLVFNYSSTAVYPSVWYISQRISQGNVANGWTDTGLVLQAGAGQYVSQNGDWGRYTAVAPVGVAYAAGDGGATGSPSMVFGGMYSSTGNAWKSRIGANRFNAPSLP